RGRQRRSARRIRFRRPGKVRRVGSAQRHSAGQGAEVLRRSRRAAEETGVIWPAVVTIVALALAFVAWLLLAPVLRERRHRRAAAAPLAPSRLDAVQRNVPIRARLPPPLRERLDGIVAAFVAEKTFVGC